MKQDKQALQISRIKEDYESVIREQKERILALRDQNTILAKRVADLEGDHAAISGALITAQQTADQIIAQAKTQAGHILAQAMNQCEQEQKTHVYYTNALQDLEKRCERILSAIAQELSEHKKSRLSIV